LTCAMCCRCVICMGEFMVGDTVRYLPCMHTYHRECIDDWLMRAFTCPSCMEPVDAALLSTYNSLWRPVQLSDCGHPLTGVATVSSRQTRDSRVDMRCSETTDGGMNKRVLVSNGWRDSSAVDGWTWWLSASGFTRAWMRACVISGCLPGQKTDREQTVCDNRCAINECRVVCECESIIYVHTVCNTSRQPTAECSTRNLKLENAVSYRLVVSVRHVMLTCCDVDVGCSIYVFTDPRPSCCVCVWEKDGAHFNCNDNATTFRMLHSVCNFFPVPADYIRQHTLPLAGYLTSCLIHATDVLLLDFCKLWFVNFRRHLSCWKWTADTFL